MSEVRVKALEWVHCSDGTAHDEGCQYEIERHDPKFGRFCFPWRVVRGVTGGGSYICHGATLEGAKGVAQADYEARILSAIDTSAVDAELVALREEVERLRGQDWQPINTAPETGEFLVGVWVGSRWSHWVASGGEDLGNDGEFGDSPTHWRPSPPLAEPPPR